MDKQENVGKIFENKVKNFFDNFNFKNINFSGELVLGGKESRIVKVDVCAGYEDTLLIIECKSKEEFGDIQLYSVLDDIKGKSEYIIEKLKTNSEYNHYKKIKFYLATENIFVPKNVNKYANSLTPPIYTLNDLFFDYYDKLHKTIGEAAVYQLLGELRIEPRVSNILQIPCFKVTIKNIDLYNFIIDPRKLIEYACVARRESGNEEYYQRMLDGKRLNDICKYLGYGIDYKDELFPIGKLFPNNVILAFFSDSEKTKSKFIPKQEFGDITFGTLIFPKSYRSCWVIDGQHRLFSFSKLSELGGLYKEYKGEKLFVTAFKDLGLSQQREIFVDINQKQTKIKGDYLWDIIGESSPKSPRGIIANTIKSLNELEFFKNKIYVPSKGSKQQKIYTLNGLCRTLERTRLTNKTTTHSMGKDSNPFYSNKDIESISKKLAKELDNYFCILYHLLECSDLEDIKNGFVMKEGGINVFLALYERFLSKTKKIPTKENLDLYLNHLMSYLKLEFNNEKLIADLRSRTSGEGPRARIVREFLVAIKEKINDPKFDWPDLEVSSDIKEDIVSIEVKLRNLIKKELDKFPNWYDFKSGILPKGIYDNHHKQLIKDRQRNQDLTEADIYDYFDLGECLTIIQSNKNIFEKIFVNLKGFRDFNTFENAIKSMSDIRGPKIHGSEKRKIMPQDIDLIKPALPILNRCIDVKMKENGP